MTVLLLRFIPKGLQLASFAISSHHAPAALINIGEENVPFFVFTFHLLLILDIFVTS